MDKRKKEQEMDQGHILVKIHLMIIKKVKQQINNIQMHHNKVITLNKKKKICLFH